MRRNARLSARRAALLTFVGFWTLLGSASAEPYIGALPSGDLVGTVVDPDLKPVAGATVWLAFDHVEGGAEGVEKTVSDGDGRFCFAKVGSKLKIGAGQWVILSAKDAGGRVGGYTVWTPVPWGLWHEDEEESRGIEIRLQDLESSEGRVVDLAGKPVAGAKVRPTGFLLPLSDRVAGGITLVPELADELAAQADGDGRFVLRAPAETNVSVVVSAPGHGRTRQDWMTDEPVTIRLGPPTTVQGRLTSSDGSGTLAGIGLRATIGPDDDASG